MTNFGTADGRFVRALDAATVASVSPLPIHKCKILVSGDCNCDARQEKRIVTARPQRYATPVSTSLKVAEKFQEIRSGAMLASAISRRDTWSAMLLTAIGSDRS